MRPYPLAVVWILAFGLGASTAAAPTSMAAAQERTERLGRVHFPVSCTADAQREFDRGVALLHSFWFRESDKAFSAVARMDPGCALAYWGIALGQRLNPISNVPSAAALRNGWAAVEQAKAVGPKTAREADYIAAVEAFYRDPEQPDAAGRFLAYERAMERLYARYPDDREAAAFYALALLPNETVLSTGKTYDKQEKAGAILEKIFAAQPDHPGAAHYLIHAYDYPALAPRALGAARAYGKIAPSSEHALHMPSHIFTRLGLWPESIEANLAAAAAAKAYARETNPAAVPTTPLHMLHWLIEAYLQGAQDREAAGILRELQALARVPDTLGSAVTAAGIPARYALERRQWAEAAGLQPRTSRYPYAEAITHFARAIGAARTGDVAGARKDVDRLQALRETAHQAKQEYWAQQIDIQRRGAAAWLAHVEGKHDEAVALMRAAVDLEDATQEHQTARDAIIPARQLLGELLLALGKPSAALKEFETAMGKEPNRFHLIAGAAEAAAQTGDTATARTHYAALVALCSRADSDRPELARAKTFLAAK